MSDLSVPFGNRQGQPLSLVKMWSDLRKSRSGTAQIPLLTRAALRANGEWRFDAWYGPN